MIFTASINAAIIIQRQGMGYKQKTEGDNIDFASALRAMNSWRVRLTGSTFSSNKSKRSTQHGYSISVQVAKLPISEK